MTAGPVVVRAGEPGPGPVTAARGEVRDLVLSVVVMHHPARGDVSALVRACAPLDVRVVEDPDPEGPPSPLRTAKRAWAAVAPGATHHLVLQDDVTPVAGFAELVRRAVRARPRHAVALYSNWNSPRNAYLVRAAAAAGQAWAPLGHDEWVPTLGLVLPADGARRLAAHLATLPDDARDDDEAVVAFCARERYPVVATLPHLLEHGDGPSLAGNDAHGARHATVPAGDVVDPDAWDRPGPERTPARVPATLRPVAVTLERSRCTLRVLRPAAGEPLEHPFGWAWDAWAGWLGVDPAVVAHDVAALAAGVCPRLGDVGPAALVELGAACWLLGSDVARTAWPPAAGPGTTAHRAAAVRTWVLSGLLPADRPEDRVDGLVAFGLDALAAGAAWATTAQDATAGGAYPAGPARPDLAAHDDRLDPAALDAVRLLAERDAAVVCRAAGPAVPVRVVVHDCASCGAQAADAVADLVAHGDLDGAAEHLVADEQDVVDEHGVAATAVGSDDTASPAVDGTGRPRPAPGGPDPVHGDGRTADARATVEVLACERLEVRGLLGLVPGGRHVSRGLWAARRASAAGEERLDAADLLAALADEAAGLPVVARAVGEPLGRPSRAPLGLQHATGAAQEYADRYAVARSARAAELL
ncbi:hypothetical protein [Cellulosimicrobium aquatile]|uniref:hypothetical protein n=1 Tax=Cellulosimicrobium aquatile TaxID=1612203 RepID=UPI001459322F|nr:hypothetical protein [Cellulosimicrobium aquatile]NMF30389.1 hypothetical protein [Cellulosimicrobium aquatile]